MQNSPDEQAPPPAQHRSHFAEGVQLELEELTKLLSHLDRDQVKHAVTLISKAPRIFTMGAGRSGLALQMAAMRLMHVGLSVHVVGETTSPAIEQDDLLLVASASGTSASVVHAAGKAKKAGAAVLAVTAQPDSKLAELADAIITLQAATKDQYGVRTSQQYAGSLFEQGVLLLLDAIFHGMWQAGGASAEQLMKRHANLE